mgnify:CR=1 FL=1
MVSPKGNTLCACGCARSAAIRSASGRVYAGCNIENAAYPQGTCAEASAIAIMVSSGEREIAEVLTVCDGDLLGTCCGGCRQKIREFHFTLYAIAAQPTLLRMIEGLWLQTGPYMNLLYPEFIASPRGPERRLRIIKALLAHEEQVKAEFAKSA